MRRLGSNPRRQIHHVPSGGALTRWIVIRKRECSMGTHQNCGRHSDTLTATVKPGNSWEKEGRRGGKLMFSESVTEYRDLSGDLVVTATSVGVRTERPATS